MIKDAELSKQLKIMMDKAIHSINVAKELHSQRHYNDAASKAYYAVFHSLQAILLTENLSFSKHTAVLSAFNKEFIYRGVFPKEFYAKTARLFKDRQIGDYEYEKNIDCKGSDVDVADSEMIIKAIEGHLKKEGYLSA
ncbi:MAG: HEPN domain-containing protein [Syntrophales bacterium]|nr:HEPN domain-containing protein [Syntrophales bacterium]